MVVPPDLDRLRKVVSRFLVASSLKRSDQPYTPYVKILGPSVDDVAVVLDAARFLLSLVDEGGRLVVEAPCEHGVFHDSCDQLVCGHDHLLTDGWYPDARAECWCPGGSRRVVWPTDKEPEEGTDATTQDLVEAVQSIGGEVLATSDSYVGATRPLAYGDSRIVVREPGRYLVLRLPDEEEE